MSPAKLDRCVTRVMEDLKKRYPDDDEAKRKSRAFAICNSAMKGGEMDYGYVVKLEDGTVPDAIHALKVGKYQHPLYGEINITPDRLNAFAANINDKVLGVDVAIDYRHKGEEVAAAWVQSAEVREDALWLSVDWTEDGKRAVEGKAFRYFSPELTDEWTDPQGSKHKDVLFGGGLTNRPWFKNLTPLNFSDFYSEIEVPDRPDDDKEVNMDPKKFAELLGIKEDEADEAKIFEAVTALKAKSDGAVKTFTDVVGIEDESKAVAEVTRLKKFYEDRGGKAEDEAKKFEADYPEEAKRLKELADKDKLTDTTIRLSEWKRNGLPPAVSDKVQEFRMELPDAEKFDEIVATILEKGVVKLESDHGGSNDPTDAKNAAQKFEEAIEAIMSENKDMEYFDAAKEAEKKHPELAKAYQRS